jgi:hypothetical protein
MPILHPGTESVNPRNGAIFGEGVGVGKRGKPGVFDTFKISLSTASASAGMYRRLWRYIVDIREILKVIRAVALQTV